MDTAATTLLEHRDRQTPGADTGHDDADLAACGRCGKKDRPALMFDAGGDAYYCADIPACEARWLAGHEAQKAAAADETAGEPDSDAGDPADTSEGDSGSAEPDAAEDATEASE